MQKLLLCMPTGVMDNNTVAAVRGFQVALGIQPSGWVDEDTARALGPRASDSLLPDWFKGCDLHPGDEGYDLAITPIGEGQAALRRFQGNHGLPATGVIDAETALLLGAL